MEEKKIRHYKCNEINAKSVFGVIIKLLFIV